MTERVDAESSDKRYVAAGDDKRPDLRALFDLHVAAIMAYVRARVPTADVSDVTAEVFAIVWRRVSSMPEMQASQRAWMYGIARRVVANHHRSLRRRRRLQERLTAAALPCASGDDVYVCERLAQALLTVSERDREILTLRYWDDLSPAEIADVCGWSLNVTNVRLHRARRRLSEKLARASLKKEGYHD